MNNDQVVPDIIAPKLNILFCGINPGLMSAATHHHFARPGNRFWKALHLSGLTPTLFHPSQQQQLLEYGIGITNFITRPSATAQELSVEEFKNGTSILKNKIEIFSPQFLVILGIDAYKKGFVKKTATVGLQKELLGKTKIWLLPNPSGLNAHYRLEDFVALFAELKVAAY